MVSCSNRLCSCSFHCFPKDALVRAESVSERRITGKPSSIGKLERHPWHCKIPETISAFCSRAFKRETAAAQSGQRIKRSKLAFMRVLRTKPGRPGGMLLSTISVLGGPGNNQAGVNDGQRNRIVKLLNALICRLKSAVRRAVSHRG